MTDPRTFGLTTRAVELLAVIREWKVLHGCVPTYREMAAAVEISVSGVHRLVSQLEARGLVRRLHGKRQSLELIEPRTVMLPADLHSQVALIAATLGETADSLVADAVRAFLPSPTTAAREREWSLSPSTF